MASSKALTKPHEKPGPNTGELKTRLESLLERSKSVKITTAEQYEDAARFLVEVRSFKKQVGFVLDPFVDLAKRSYDDARNERAKWLASVETIDKTISDVAGEWKRREREAAEAEQRRINEERRREAERIAAEERRQAEEKATTERKERERLAEIERKKREDELKKAQKSGDISKRELNQQMKISEEEASRQLAIAQEEERKEREAAEREERIRRETVKSVTVKPSVPTVAGIRARVNYYGEFIDGGPILAEYRSTQDPDRARFLFQFLSVNDQNLGKFARETKDSKKVMELVPGSRAWEKDAV